MINDQSHQKQSHHSTQFSYVLLEARKEATTRIRNVPCHQVVEPTDSVYCMCLLLDAELILVSSIEYTDFSICCFLEDLNWNVS